MLIETNTNKTWNCTIWFCYFAEAARLVTLVHLHSFTDTCTDSSSTDSTDSWPMCTRLKKLLQWEGNSAETTKISRKVKFSSEDTSIYQVYWENYLKGYLLDNEWRIMMCSGRLKNMGIGYCSGRLSSCSKTSQAQRI